MVYVALLRGINVGGKNTVSMKRLIQAFEKAGMRQVSTYINSGNIFFQNTSHSLPRLTSLLETAVITEFGFAVKVLVRDLPAIQAIAKALPDSWQNNSDMKCDVMFLWEQFDRPDVLQDLRINPSLEDVRYVAGAIIWRVDRANASRSSIMRLIGTELYKHMTIRNCNTLRAIQARMEAHREPIE
jgi:uncharacterized protein (DUF1697 family)